MIIICYCPEVSGDKTIIAEVYLFDSDMATCQCTMRRNIDDIDNLIIINMTGIENTRLRNS